jgi:hypothetical protein
MTDDELLRALGKKIDGDTDSYARSSGFFEAIVYAVLTTPNYRDPEFLRKWLIERLNK